MHDHLELELTTFLMSRCRRRPQHDGDDGHSYTNTTATTAPARTHARIHEMLLLLLLTSLTAHSVACHCWSKYAPLCPSSHRQVHAACLFNDLKAYGISVL